MNPSVSFGVVGFPSTDNTVSLAWHVCRINRFGGCFGSFQPCRFIGIKFYVEYLVGRERDDTQLSVDVLLEIAHCVVVKTNGPVYLYRVGLDNKHDSTEIGCIVAIDVQMDSFSRPAGHTPAAADGNFGYSF